jgi:phosphate transport system permease protein
MSTTTPGNPLILRPVRGARRRRIVSRSFDVVFTLATLLAVAVLLWVIVSVVIKGASALNWRLLTSDPKISPFGQNTGGIANAIVGSAILIAIASAIAIPIGILVALFMTEFASAKVSAVERFLLDILAGVPEIVVGVFIFGVLVVGSHQSGWAGAIALSILEIPTVARSAQEVLVLVPDALREAGLALGLRRWRIVLRIVLPTALGGLLTGAVLGVARVTGETASLLLTTSVFSNNGLTVNPSQPLPNIPVEILTLSESPKPSDHAQAWAASLVLIAFVLLLSVIARAIHERSRAKLRG